MVDSTGFSDSVSVGGNNVPYNVVLAFYAGPQVNNGVTNTATVGYHNSNIRNQINAWFNAQSDEFKSSIKESNITYETATLTFDGSNYSQTINGSVEVAEKVYIPSKADLESGKLASNPAYTSNYFWTSTPYAFSGYAITNRSFGSFYGGNGGFVGYDNGYDYHGAVALFKIG